MGMSPLPQNPQTPAPLNDVTIGKLIEDRIERERVYLKFAQDQTKIDREYFKHLFDWAVGAIGLIILAAGFFGFRSIDQLKETINTRALADLQAMRTSVQATTEELKSTSKRELDNVRVEVQKRVNDEFKDENITALVRTAAKERTEKEFQGIIRSETGIQVSKAIDQQGPTIKKAVEDETKRAVHDLAPTINAIVTKESQIQVQKFTAPVQSQLNAYGEMLNVGTLATLAKSGHRKSFDQLWVLFNSTKLNDVKFVAETTARGIIREKATSLRMKRTFKFPQTPETMKELLILSPQVEDRLGAMDNYPENDVSVLPVLVQVIKNDESIDVVAAAFQSFDARTHQTFQFPEYDQLTDWWKKNSASFQTK